MPMKLRFEVPEAVARGLVIKTRVAIFKGATMLQYNELPAAYISSAPKCYKTAGNEDVFVDMGGNIEPLRVQVGRVYTLREIEAITNAIEMCGARLRIVQAYAKASRKTGEVGRLFSIRI